MSNRKKDVFFDHIDRYVRILTHLANYDTCTNSFVYKIDPRLYNIFIVCYEKLKIDKMSG